MLLQSPGLLWAMVQVLISGSQCVPRSTMLEMQLDTEWTPIKENTCILDNSLYGLPLVGIANINDCKENCKEPACKSVDYRKLNETTGDCRRSSTDASGPCFGAKRQFTAKVEPVCPSPFTVVGNQCFVAIPSTDYHPFPSWESARAYCVYQYPGITDLASPKDLIVLNEYLATSGFGKVWIGGYNFEKNFNSTSDREWLWMDRKPINYQFAESRTYPPGNCVYMSNLNSPPSLVSIKCDATGAAGFGQVCERYI